MTAKDQLQPIHFSAGAATDEIIAVLTDWQDQNKVKRLWSSDAKLWTNDDEAKWMGWLDLSSDDIEVSRIVSLTKELKAAKWTDLVVLGMGGSSLCPAVLAETFGVIAGFPHLHILDSTDPAQILHLESQLNLQKTLFIVASKSGSTLEPNIMKDYFCSRMQEVLGKKEVGDHFVAITDPGSSLEKLATKEQLKAIFYGLPSIGGRYSALSHFGMVPAGLMGLDIKSFLRHASAMQKHCSPTVEAKENPGLLLGVILGVCANLGKNKVTLIASPGIHALGAWIEQLLAESTGKIGKGLIPVDLEPLGEPVVYGNDRVFVYMRLDNATDPVQDHAIKVLEQAGFVVVQIHLPDIMHLGAEFYRWEFATAVAGSIIGINPFNQPDVEASKKLALQMTTQYEQNGELPDLHPLFVAEGLMLFSDEKNSHELAKRLNGVPSIAGYIKAHLDQINVDDYVTFSAFIEMSKTHTDLLQKSRLLIRNHKKVATCLGFGPRFLHSTGQAYKGGPNTGVFLQITADHNQDIQVPDHQYSFGLVIKAQALADFNVLAQRERRILRVHLGKDVEAGLQQLEAEINKAFS